MKVYTFFILNNKSPTSLQNSAYSDLLQRTVAKVLAACLILA